MGLGDTKATDFIKSFLVEAVKTHAEYDGSSRITDLYVAPTDAANGDTCTRTRYTYSGATTNVVGTKEELGTWQSAWDI